MDRVLPLLSTASRDNNHTHLHPVSDNNVGWKTVLGSSQERASSHRKCLHSGLPKMIGNARMQPLLQSVTVTQLSL